MNRFMVALGIGTLLLGTNAQADFPVSIRGAAPAAKMVPAITWHTDLQSGWREAKRQNLPMVIFITSDSCVYCDAMKQNTWCNATVQSRLAGKFVAIRLNKTRNEKTLRRIKVDTYPTTLMGSPKGKIVAHRYGYQPPEAFEAFLTEALQVSEAKNKISEKTMTANNVH